MLHFLFLALAAGAGFPGPESRADYLMEVSLLPDSGTVEGRTAIHFTSGAPFPVDTLWLHLYPNAYRDHTTPFGRDLEAVGRFGFRASGAEKKGWIELSGWSLDGVPVEVEVDDCIGFIPLENPLEPGATAVLRGDFKVQVPAFWSRMGRSGETWQMTQWYPKMCALDGNGWHRGRYRWRGEFFSDFGDYSVELTVPARFITAATGSVEEVRFPADSTLRTESWRAAGVHDFAWSASPRYVLREHTYVYPEELGACSVRVHLVLLDDDPGHWEDVPAVIDSTLLYYGEWYTPYPYGDLWVVEPVVLMAGGMEYPQFVFSAADIPMTRALEMVTAHEVGHQWFYGMLASDEVEEAWLDEGMNTFSELRFMERRYGFFGNMTTTPDWLLEVSDLDMNFLSYVAGTAGGERVPVLSDATSAGDGSHPTGFTYYTKPALFMRMLHRQVGEEDFHRIMSVYFDRFMYRHPHTDDFRAVVEEVTGRSWREEFDFWLRGTASTDVRVADVRHLEDSTLVVIEDDFPHEVSMDLLMMSGEDSLLTEVPLSLSGQNLVSVPGRWNTVIADPYLFLPDRAPWNNSLPVRAQLKPLLLPYPRPSHYTLWALPFPSFAAGSWTAELLLMSAPVTSYTGGPYTWTANVSVPLQDEGYTAWGGHYHAPLFRRYRRSMYMSVSVERGYGLGRASLGADYLFAGRVASDLRGGLSLDARLFAVEDTTVYGSSSVEEGRGIELTGGFSLADMDYHVSWDSRIEAMYSPGWNGGDYSRLDWETDITTRFHGDYLARTRIYAGRVFGGAPVHALLRPGGGLFPAGAVAAFLPPDGPLSPGEHYYVRSGPALPGYWNSDLRGRASFTVQQRLPLPLPVLPVEVFGTAGWLAGRFRDFSRDAFLADAGFAVRVAMLEVLFPLWVYDPGDDEDEWEFRWRLGLSPAGFPDLY